MPATVADLAAAAAAGTPVRVTGPGEAPVAGIATDSRAVRRDWLFAALAGQHADGHRFLGAAAAAGASALLVAEGRAAEAPAGPAVVEARDLRLALGLMADRFHGHPTAALDLVAVTGTNGKTTATWLLEAIALAAGRPPGLIGTILCRFAGRELPAGNTTPEAPELQRLLREMADAGTRLVALEASSHALALGRLAGARVRVAVFTNLGRDHLDFHGDLERYFAAKLRLFTDFAPAAAVVNADDPRAGAVLAAARGRALTFGFSQGADLRAVDLATDAGGLAFTILSGGERVPVRSRLVGPHNAANILAAAGAARALGIGWDAIRAGVGALARVPGRLERVDAPAGPAVFVDYAHTPDALEHALATGRALARGRLVAVFGCGGDRDRGKRPLMGAAAARLADLVIVTSDNPRSENPDAIIAEILAGSGAPGARARVVAVADRRAAIRAAVAAAGVGDVVIIAGKGHEDYQVAGGAVAHFSDREEAAAALAAAGGGA